MGPITIGPLLRRLRAELGRSQSEQAAVLSDLAGRPVTRNEVSRWESEARLLTPYWQEHHARSFDVDVDTLSRAVGAAKSARQRKQDYSRAAGDDVDRRAFLGAATSVALSWPLVGRSGRVGADDVTKLSTRTARLRRLDDFLGGADTYQLFVNEMDATAALLRGASFTTSNRNACTAVLAEQAQLAGWAAFDAGRHDEARKHYATSLDAAREAGNHALAGNALAFMAYQEVSVNGPDLDMASASVEVARRGATPRVEALLLERLAWSHAVAGHAQDTERALSLAQEAGERSGSDPEPDWVFWVDEDELQIMTGRCWAQLSRPLRAVPVLEGVLRRYDDTHARDKAMYLTWLAHAYLDAGEVDLAAEAVGRSISLACGVASERPKSLISGVLHRLEPFRTSTEVRAVFEAAR